MKEYEKPKMDVILINSNVITSSECPEHSCPTESEEF